MLSAMASASSPAAPTTYPSMRPPSSIPTGWVPYLLGLKGTSGYGSASTAEQVAASWNGEGKTIIVTGALRLHTGDQRRVLGLAATEMLLLLQHDTPRSASSCRCWSRIRYMCEWLSNCISLLLRFQPFCSDIYYKLSSECSVVAEFTYASLLACVLAHCHTATGSASQPFLVKEQAPLL